MPAETLIAEFTAPTKRRHGEVAIARIGNGRRVYLERVSVANRGEARAIAADRGAQPWNF